MNETPKAGRITFALPDGTVVRIQPHKDDSAKVAIKADSADILDNFAMLGGVDLKSETKTGGSYAILLADKAATADALRNIVLAFAPATTVIADPTGDTEDGSDDADVG